MAHRIFVASNKGGPGKTSECVGLIAALAGRGLRVLAVDMDPQGNLTRRLGLHSNHLLAQGAKGIADVLDPDAPVHPGDALVLCSWSVDLAERIHVIPSLAVKPQTRRAKEGAEPGAVQRLRRALDLVDADHHVVVIDGGPGLDHLFDMALAASDYVVVVVVPEFDEVEGGRRVVQYVATEREHLGRPELEVIGVVVNKVDEENSATHRANLANLPTLFGSLLWRPYVPFMRTWSAANNDGVPLKQIRTVQSGHLKKIFDGHAARITERMGIPA